MKKSIMFSIAALMLVFNACNNSSPKNENPGSGDSSKTAPVKPVQQFSLDTTAMKAGEIFYQCSMDLEVISDKPGSCPKCGMDLDKVVKK